MGCGAQGSAAPPLAVKGFTWPHHTHRGQNLTWPLPSKPWAPQPQCGVLGRSRAASSSWILRPRIHNRGSFVSRCPMCGCLLCGPLAALFYFTYQTLI